MSGAVVQLATIRAKPSANPLDCGRQVVLWQSSGAGSDWKLSFGVKSHLRILN